MSFQKILYVFLLLLFAQLLSCNPESELPPDDREILGNTVKPDIIDEYIYPIRPGMPEWAALQSHDEMEAVLQIPDQVFQTISTWGLVASCFNYPLGGDNMAMNCPSDWINYLSKSFSGLNELFARPDVSIILLFNYRNLDFKKYPGWMDWRYIELMIGCDAFISKLNERQLLYLVTVALKKAQEQRDYFKSSSPPNSDYIMGNAMIHAGYQPFIDYCVSNNSYNAGAFRYWAMNNDAIKIEKFAHDFVGN